MSTAPIVTRRFRAVWFIPFVLLLAAGLLANVGMSPVPNASAATDSVTVTASVSSSLSVADGCSGAMSITVAMGAHADATCAINFGSTNDADVTLRAAAAASPFIASFANNSDACAALGSVDESGLKVVSVGGTVTRATAWTCALTAAGTNAGYNGLTTTATNVCQTNATLGTSQTCTLGVGVWEQGSNLAPGSYTGTVNLDVIA